MCVETLRQEGFKGRIVFVCKEQALPYDRIRISKTLDVKLEGVTLRAASFYKVSFWNGSWGSLYSGYVVECPQGCDMTQLIDRYSTDVLKDLRASAFIVKEE